MDRNKGQPLRLDIKPLYGIVGPFIIGILCSQMAIVFICKLKKNNFISIFINYAPI